MPLIKMEEPCHFSTDWSSLNVWDVSASYHPSFESVVFEKIEFQWSLFEIKLSPNYPLCDRSNPRCTT